MVGKYVWRNRRCQKQHSTTANTKPYLPSASAVGGSIAVSLNHLDRETTTMLSPSRYLAHGCYAMTTYNPSSGTWSKTHSSISVEFKHNQGRHPPQALQSTWPSETLFVGACAKTLLSFSIYLPYCFSTELRCTALVLQGPALLIEWLKLICVTETVKGQVVLESTLFQKTWAKGKMMSVSWDQLSA